MNDACTHYSSHTPRMATGSVATIWGLDEKSPPKPIEPRVVREVVSTVVRDFVRECERDGCVDEFAEDQLVIFQALNNGSTRVDADGGLLGREQRQRLDGYERDETESGSLHTRTRDGEVEEVNERLASVMIDEPGSGRRKGKKEEGMHE
ncbi:hypothetical protein LTR47_008443 [Exophiala xenobiotica]|nr:hypothetical protein LTR41_010559 [Exophiala xenobiotica]KAK5227871.1 hypothetical protein LTR47_008443 [Exophiala xenobiotica]KAK5253406.1 hypothetical protein LTS06_002116 [Exophiala xenobiotica]KAK5317546.1 hypothetical protein LTR93_008758 [Exophiala xenobiotica]KAK5346690.1 hypothetical protein LTR61_009639 [Exophiala xenobiotica]